MNEDRALSVLEQSQFWTNEIYKDAVRQRLKLPFQVEHITEGVGFQSVDVNICDDGVLRFMPDCEPWPLDFDPGEGQTVFLTLTDATKRKMSLTYKLSFFD